MVQEQLSLYFDDTSGNGTTPFQITDTFDPQSTASLIVGDTQALCRELPEETFQLILTSPPYNIGKDYEETRSLEEYLAQQAAVIRLLVRLLKPEGSLCWQVGNFIDTSSACNEVYPLDVWFYPIFKEQGLQLRNRVIWHFEHGLHASSRFSGRYETLLWFTKTDNYYFNVDPVRVPAKYPGKRAYKGENRGKPSGNPLGKNPSDYWRFDTETFLEQEWTEAVWEIPNVKSNHPEKTVHPCQFPVELVERCILSMTQPGNLVLDPYGGVGTTAIAAVKHGRKAVSIDKEAAYMSLARKRLTMLAHGTLEMRPMGKPVHTPSGKVAQVPIEWQER